MKTVNSVGASLQVLPSKYIDEKMVGSGDTYHGDQESKPLLDDDKEMNKEIQSINKRMRPYLVLMSSFFSFALAAGFNFGIAGALTVAQSQRFNISLNQASWSTSIHTVFFLMTNPLTAILTRLVSIRKVQLLGCIVSLLGIGLCGFATEHWHVVILFGFVAGVGLSFNRAALFGILAYHFEKQRLDMALAVVCVGFCSGWLIVPAPTSYLFIKYGFNNTMLIVSPLMLVHLLGALFYSQDTKTVTKENLPESTSLNVSLKEVVMDYQIWIFMLSALARKFGQGGFFTIYQDYAKQQLGLTLPESGKGGTIYGGTAGIAVAFISLTHALKWNYSKPVSLAISGLLDGLAIFLISTAKNKTFFYLFISFLGLVHGLFLGNFISFGSEIAGARNIVFIQAFEGFGTGLGGFIAPPVTSYLQSSVSYKFGFYAAGTSMIACGILTAVIGFQRRHQNGTETDDKNKHLQKP